MFDFRIISMLDGTEIIDMTLKTPYESLTPSQMVEYTEMDKQLAYMDRIKEKKQRKAEHRFISSLLHRFVCLWGIE